MPRWGGRGGDAGGSPNRNSADSLKVMKRMREEDTRLAELALKGSVSTTK